jgi:hypothetical protein
MQSLPSIFAFRKMCMPTGSPSSGVGSVKRRRSVLWFISVLFSSGKSTHARGFSATVGGVAITTAVGGVAITTSAFGGVKAALTTGTR